MDVSDDGISYQGEEEVCAGGVCMSLCVPEPQIRERRGTREDSFAREGAFGRCQLQGLRAASPHVVSGVVVVGGVTLVESVRHLFGGGRGGVTFVFIRGRCVWVVLLGLRQGHRLCIRGGVEQSAVREDVGACGAEPEEDAPFPLLLWEPLVGFTLWSVEGDVVARSPALVGKEAEHGVFLWVLYVLHVRSHVRDVDGVLILPFLCWTARRADDRVSVEFLPRNVGKVALEGCLPLGWALTGLVHEVVVL